VCVCAAQKSAFVVGGGVIGLASAFRLAQRGVAVTLFDPNPGKGATWAAAGMIAPVAEIGPGEHENFQLQKGALSAWREVASDLQALTGELLTIVQNGTLLIGWDGSDRRLVDQFAQVAGEFGAKPLRVRRDSNPDMFDGVTGRIDEGLLVEGDAWIDPDQAVALLVSANQMLGVTVVHQSVLNIDDDEAHVKATTESETLGADLGIIATGADPLPQGASASGQHVVRPVHGITVRVRGMDRSTRPMIRSFVRGSSVYMVSRPGGYNVLGASSEERGETGVQVGEMQRLLRDALDVVPSLETATVIETRAGNRPASENLQPFFEILGGGRWAWSSGHFRHGVTLAPLAALEAVRFMERA
jgi:glycine oxidase